MSDEKKIELKEFVFEDTTYKTTLPKKFTARKPWKQLNPKQALSYIPGTIISIAVNEGQEVKEGQPMLVLESMKMYNQVKVPRDGKVKKIYITPGEKIPKNHLMIDFE